MLNNCVLRDEYLHCVHLYDEKGGIDDFEVADSRGAFLAEYIKSFAFKDERLGDARTYLVYDNETNELVAYFSLKAGFVSVNERRNVLTRTFDSRPGVELANFAVNAKYIRNHPEAKGIGGYLIDEFIIPIVKSASEIIGVKYLYIFALPYDSLIARYKELGFTRLPAFIEKYLHKRIKPNYDRDCVFMYQVLQ